MAAPGFLAPPHEGTNMQFWQVTQPAKDLTGKIQGNARRLASGLLSPIATGATVEAAKLSLRMLIEDAQALEWELFHVRA